jgi:hypothetical protein
MAIDLHPPLHTKSESQSAILFEPARPGSARPGSSRPGSQRSNTLVKKEKTRKVSVEDILAMRRLEQGSQQGSREYPGIQPTKLTRIAGEEEYVWPTYRFGEGNEWNRG